MIVINDFTYDYLNEVLIDFNGEKYKSFDDSDNCINLIKYNEELEIILLSFKNTLKSLNKDLSKIEKLITEYYSIRKKICN